MHPDLKKDIKNLNALSIEKKYELIGFSNLLDENKKIKIPENISQIKIDIGLSFSAPNASLWLCETDDRMVFGFEPSPFCTASLVKGIGGRNGIGEHQAAMCIGEGVIYKNNEIVESEINNRFTLVQCALDDVGKHNPQFVTFYQTLGDPGCSSLSMPTDKLI